MGGPAADPLIFLGVLSSFPAFATASTTTSQPATAWRTGHRRLRRRSRLVAAADIHWLAIVGFAILILIMVMRDQDLANSCRAPLLVTGIIYIFGCWKCAALSATSARTG